MGCSALTEIPYEESLLGVGSPLSIDNIVVLIDIETEYISSLEQCSQYGCVPSRVPRAWCLEAACLGELGQATFCLINFLDPALGAGDSSLQHVLERREPGIDLQHTWEQVSCVLGECWRGHKCPYLGPERNRCREQPAHRLGPTCWMHARRCRPWSRCLCATRRSRSWTRQSGWWRG